MNEKHLKITFLLTLKKNYATFILLYLRPKYEPIWPELIVQTVIYVLVVLCEQAWHYKLTCFDSKIWPYGLIFHPQVEENEGDFWLIIANIGMPLDVFGFLLFP